MQTGVFYNVLVTSVPCARFRAAWFYGSNGRAKAVPFHRTVTNEHRVGVRGAQLSKSTKAAARVNSCPFRFVSSDRFTGTYFGLVIAPWEADATRAAYFAKTPVAYRGCGAFHSDMRCRNTSSLSSTCSTCLLTSK